MYTVVNPLSKYLKFKSVRIYDTIFTLHSKCTMVLLLASCGLLSAKQYFGNPIECISDSKKTEYVTSYCWTMGTYIFDCFGTANCSFSAYSMAEGVGPFVKTVDDKRLWLRYYQWVIVVLFVQALVFYFPSFLWKVWEGDRLKNLCTEVADVLVTKDIQDTRLKMLSQYFTSDYHTVHLFYLAKYLICEFLNFLISIANILALDVFLNGFWSKYIYALLAIPEYDWTVYNHMSSRIFPKVAKCDVYITGPSGSKINYDALCLLPLNILNEKIFAFLWCWFLFIGLLAGVNLMYRTVLLLNSELRLQLLRTQIRFMPKAHVKHILKNANAGDWFILFRVAINMNPTIFRELMQEIYEVRRKQDMQTSKS